MHLYKAALAILSSAVASGCTANARFDLDSNKPHTVESRRPAEQAPYSAPQPEGPANSGSPAPEQPAEFQGQKLSGRLSGEPPVTDTRGWSARRTSDVEVNNGAVHVVRQGDTLTAIARQHGVTVPMLYAANGLLNDRLTPGQHVVIPSAR